MQAKDVMATDVITVAPQADVAEAAKIMLDKHVSGLVVVDGQGALQGIVSEGDLLHRTEAGTQRHPSWWLRLFSPSYDPAAEYVKSHARKVADVMVRDVVSVTEDTPLGEIAQTLERRRIKRVPVLRGGRVVGVVSRADLLRAVATRQPDMAGPAMADDRAIRERLLATIRSEELASSSYVNVVVSNGFVHLWGMVEKESERKALLVAAREIEGVNGVEDHLTRAPSFIGL